jgi:hypothetical protein
MPDTPVEIEVKTLNDSIIFTIFTFPSKEIAIPRLLGINETLEIIVTGATMF